MRVNIAYHNTETAAEQHGGNLSALLARYPDAPRPLIDLSTGINPYAYPAGVKPQWLHRLPDETDMAHVIATAAKYYAAGHVALASGMQPIIAALAALRPKDDVGILSPTYSEHGKVWEALGHKVHAVDTIADMGRYPVAIVTNPNNPDGRQCAPEQLLQVARQVELLIVDESFADVMPENSVAAQVGRAGNIVVLRSCGKFFGMAGLRASAAISSKPRIAKLNALLGPWPISNVACHILPVMFEDAAWIQDIRERLQRESIVWRELLAEYFTIVGHTPLFTLVETDDAAKWQDYLASQGIASRAFGYNPRWLRLGLPDADDLPRIQEALRRI